MAHVVGGNSYRGRKTFLVAGFVYPPLAKIVNLIFTAMLALILFPSNFNSSLLGISGSVLQMFSPFLIPLVAVVLFTTTLSIVINRIRQVPMEPGGITGGFFSRLIKQKKLIALLFATTSAFSIWLSAQPQDFRTGFLFPIELYSGVITSNAPLYTLATTLGGIAVIVLFL